ncbi:prolyl 4-hydroxylase subunit alpha-2-like [Haematobia irritans]|uniref:prolyl 4-hydroxylase subunit alpha-2-like n=1 Tax=Haematobia irritans TaxID=7368 RepID=UPI003F505AD7
MRLLCNFSFLVLFLSWTVLIKCDYYTSVSSLDTLLSAEKYYMSSLEKHLQEVQRAHSDFESFLKELELEHTKIHTNNSQFFDDPVNAFKIIRRMVVDVQQMGFLVANIHDVNVFNESAKSAIGNQFSPPTEEDLKGAVLGFSRLQKTYKLDSGDMAEGYLRDFKYSSSLSAYDCFILGRILYESEDFQLASEWLTEALHKAEDIEDGVIENDEDIEEMEDNIDEDESSKYEIIEEEVFPDISVIAILEYLPAALHNSGRTQLALAMNAKLLELDPENVYGLANQSLYMNGVKEQRRKRIISTPPKVSDRERLYHQVCSGEVHQSPAEKRHLRCRYVTNNVPYYYVGPMKMEELSLDPFVAYYHQAICDDEMEDIIEAVSETLERSKVGQSSVSRYDEVRVSKNSWLRYEENRFLDKISQRLQDITGLSIRDGEYLQVVNYGIGGHYGPHHDFFPKQEKDMKGNRILTALFYINDVELGGATAFPALKLAVQPIRGSLVMWYNYHKSLEKDFRTWHAGCPVLQGSKWVCNEWFSTYGQEFNRPCGLQPDHEISKPYEHW